MVSIPQRGLAQRKALRFVGNLSYGLAHQTAACCSLRSRRDLYFEIIQIGITRNADTEPRVCASPVLQTLRFFPARLL